MRKAPDAKGKIWVSYLMDGTRFTEVEFDDAGRLVIKDPKLAKEIDYWIKGGGDLVVTIAAGSRPPKNPYCE